MHKKRNGIILKKILAPVILFISVIIGWELIVLFGNIKEYILPKPSQIFSEIILNFSYLLQNLGITFSEALIGFVLANLIGLFIAIIFVRSRTIKRGLYPYAIAIKTAPVVALAPLFVLWFGTGMSSKIAIVMVICFFPILISAIKGLEDVPLSEIELFKSLKASRWETLIKLRIPNALPHIFSALKISSSLAIVGAIVGEFAGANKGIGFAILNSSYQFETVTMFAAIILASFLGIIFFGAISYIEKKVVFWKE